MHQETIIMMIMNFSCTLNKIDKVLPVKAAYLLYSPIFRRMNNISACSTFWMNTSWIYINIWTWAWCLSMQTMVAFRITGRCEGTHQSVSLSKSQQRRTLTCWKKIRNGGGLRCHGTLLRHINAYMKCGLRGKSNIYIVHKSHVVKITNLGTVYFCVINSSYAFIWYCILTVGIRWHYQPNESVA